jgi:hypothetical protein
MNREFDPLVKQVLDGERASGELPPSLRAEGEAAQSLLAAVDRSDVVLSPHLDTRVMAVVRHHAASPRYRAWRWLTAPSVPPWVVGALVAAAIALVLIRSVSDGRRVAAVPAPAAPDSVYVRFVLFAADAHRVALAGTFNRWDPATTPLTPTGAPGVWTVTVALPVGQHQYGFIVDGQNWIPDPAAPSIDDGFGRRNSVVSVSPVQGRVL